MCVFCIALFVKEEAIQERSVREGEERGERREERRGRGEGMRMRMRMRMRIA